ncbi:MAG: hypothetical protein ACYDD1_12850 [Caulobacteraceae bacterium]
MSEKSDADHDFMAEALEEEERVEHGLPEKPFAKPDETSKSLRETDRS